MELKLFNLCDQKVLTEEKVKEVRLIKLYFLGYNRNAWNSTWIERYWKQGSIHTSLKSAQEKAEKERIQGNKFFIFEFIATAFVSKKAILVLTLDFNFLDQFVWKNIIEIKLKNNKVFFEPLKIIGSNFSEIANSISKKNNYFLEKFYFGLNGMSEINYLISENTFYSYSSYSWGGEYRLGWSKVESKSNWNIVYDSKKILLDILNKDVFSIHFTFNYGLKEYQKIKKIISSDKILQINKLLPNSSEIWLNQKLTGFSKLCALNKIKIKNSLYILSKRDWWNSETIRIDFSSSFYYVSFMDKKKLDLINDLIGSLLRQAIESTITKKNRFLILSFNNASLSILFFKIDLKNSFVGYLSIDETIKKLIQNIQVVLNQEVVSNFEKDFAKVYSNRYGLQFFEVKKVKTIKLV